ncbi:MAG: YecA family protein, partial [Actinomycetes bacterium]
AAMEVDPGFGPSVAELAWYASDRGRAREAVNLLHRVRDHDDPVLALLRRLAAASAPSVGRNDRCPCGSGRKYKVCHLGRSALGDQDRVRWLLEKLAQYALDVVPPEELDEAIPPTHHTAALALGMDVLAFERGWLARFRRDREPLLPDVERAWLDRWLDENVASVFRLVARLPDGRAELDDVRTGRRHVVGATPILDRLPVDRLVWARLVPVDDLWWTTGVVRPCSLAERDGLLDAFAPGTTAQRRLEALVRGRDGLVLQNTSGDPNVMCTTVVRVEDAADAEKHLDEAFERDGESPEWRTTADTAGMADAVTAHYRLDGGLLRIETNSLARRAAALDRLAGVVKVA